MILQLSVKNQSIESSGITNDYKEAICEYIWNGFEAHATEVNIDYSLNIASGVSELSISDNGDGIVYDDLSDTFGAFLTSQKNLLSLKMKSRANKGKGRFSFSAFATGAKWITTYKDSDSVEYKAYEIILENDKKEVLSYTEPKVSAIRKAGTKVEFDNIFSLTAENMAFEVLEPALLKEFAWFLYLCKGRNLKININGKPIEYEKYINTEFSEKTITTIAGSRFEVTLIVWAEAIKEKFCCYFFDSKDEVKSIETTSFNRNTVEFNHSVFVKSDFFDGQENDCMEMESDQISLFTDEDDKKVYKELKKFIAKFIEKKIGNYMSQKADDAVRQMIEERKTFPKFPDDPYGKMQKQDLEKVTKEIYKNEPKIFYKLKPVQEKSLLGFLNLLLNSRERENVLTIVEQIVELTPEQRQDFSDMLRKTKLENVIETIKFVQDRYKVIELLRTIVFDMTQYANERDHIQKIVQQHFWLFGEQFNLASADERMKNALEKYINILYGVKDIEATLDEDAEQERRMDRQVKKDDYLLVDGLHEALVSEEVWEQAQVKVAAQAKKYEKVNRDKREKIHLLSGILKCPVCGAGMYGNKSIKKRKDGSNYKDFYYYGCKHRNMTRGHKCDYKKQVHEEMLDASVAEVISKLVSNPKFSDLIRNKINMEVDTSALDFQVSHEFFEIFMCE